MYLNEMDAAVAAEATLKAQGMYAVLVQLFLKEGLAQKAEQVTQNEALNDAQGDALKAPKGPTAPALLGVEQIRTTPEGASMQTRQARPAPGGSLQAPDVRQGKNAEALPQAQTSATCDSADSSAECLLLSKPTQDWRNQTGGSVDPLTGAPLIPGISTTTGGGMNPGMMQGSPRQ
jgi:hypothetical protein